MERLVSIDPSTGSPVGSVPVTPVDDVGRIVARARDAQRVWGALPLHERAARLRPAGPALRAAADALAALVTAEMGKPLADARGEAHAISHDVEREIDEIVAAFAPVVSEGPRTRSTLVRDPLGVAACITPWNFPLLMPHEQLLPALLAGNGVVYKPSEETPLSGQAYADLLRKLLPDDVLTVIQGDERQGRALVSADVDLVVFTGSREAGKHILTACAGSLKRVILELGGKDPLLVLDDADLDAAAAFAARNSFRNSGQVCVATERIYVSRHQHDDFVGRLVAASRAWKAGDGREDGVRVGPMVNERQCARVARLVDAAVASGATTAWKADAPEGAAFFPPTVLTGLRDDMAIAVEETFGPVACVFPVDDDEEAVRRANATRYGLGAVVFGAPEHARAVASRLVAGMVGINQSVVAAPGMPWVGARESGYGFHSGPEGHRQFTQVKVLSEPR
jgi:acyl-CoA reductase-like NAD-dependent aldehyde dehydrogenase